MKAVAIAQPGGPEVLQLTDRPLPEPRAGEALIRVHAAGVNRPDILQRQGQYAPPPGASDLPGLEIAGVIERGDLRDSPFAVGDAVCALLTGGGYAEYCTAPVGQLLPVPRGASFAEAAGLPETFFTVWSNVFDRARLAPGESLLVHGGTSGIGVAAIQLAAVRGHTVFATAGSDEKCRACEALGAKRAFNYRSEDFAAAVREQTGGRGVDVILDMVAGDYIARDLSCLAEDGRIAVIAALGGRRAEIDAALLLRRRLTITGSTLRPRSAQFKAALAARLRAEVWPFIEAGRIKPMLFKTFALAQASAAQQLMESGAHIGKIVLAVTEAAAQQPQRADAGSRAGAQPA